ncbi:MAG: single-stranded-DNA-specific exonuclease RecJ [Ruminococcus sp.]
MTDAVSSFANRMEKWVIAAKRADFQEIADTFGIDPVTARLIRNRDVVGMDEIQKYLHGGLSLLPSPWLMKDMEKAVDILEGKIKEGRRIRIIGDYDIDGVMSSYILEKGLKELGAEADVMIPHRITDGYGINESLILRAAGDKVDTIVTCDNGIAAAEQTALAKEKGLTVIVTDHHEVPYVEKEGERREILPPADAVINLKQKGCGYPFKLLCGAAVAGRLVSAMYDRFNIDPARKEEFLEYEAIATIGDVMDLKGDNRILVKEGLKRLHHTSNYGLQALIEVNGLTPEQITPYHIGFVIGPCLNASGRLDTARKALELLWAATPEEGRTLAEELKELNEERKTMTEKGVEEAAALVEETDLGQDRVLVVYLPKCHESLAGIIAGRLRERYHKPAFVLTGTDKGAKGSGRSIETYSMYEELVKVKDLLERFGGHPMAAGISLKEENVEPFRRMINEKCMLTEEDLLEKVVIDVAMPISYIRKDLIEELELLEPFGKGNTKPVFAQKNIRPVNCRVFGKNRNVVKMKLMDEWGNVIDGVYFGEGDEFVRQVRQKGSIDMVYYPAIDRWQGRESLQVVVTHFQ